MKRRDYLKNIGLSSLGLAALNPQVKAMEALEGAPDPKKVAPLKVPNGRTMDEAERDAKLMAEKFLNAHELATITILSDIIIPADAKSGSASQSGVTKFIEFIVKDKPEFKTPMRGGLRWLDGESKRRFSKLFTEITPKQRIEIVEDIAYPEKVKPQFSQGVNFFTLMRNLTATGFYTSRIGLDDLAYKGNTPNDWKGVPDEVLKQYGLSYDD
ncbi:gluconate 2-dehydrogenase subunit 3 family protein [Aquirufa ecclesiirivi]|uniref:Gluconate 2-dehydrogenase subunit 3 family protein n=1 Tax=Aquirufa ecclesiirivi TaxID=2715124 RepID=A0ABT4JGP1_9BACT|nr:gluconate 2-dehydrogenase subunit 3 family protein [Aquirufa ecclesiirivi]MCZ2475442.1 gluconate 2-dehydrogenase subunit 3 family protein [Aquirufa ecclesiirivi]MDF0694244.1 gluconate 2-dehydrogenase subunit 3 family protein [Aquirufa ecclesiirivi]